MPVEKLPTIKPIKETNRIHKRPVRESVLVRHQPRKFGHWNCRTLKGIETVDLEQLILERRCDVLGLCKTRLSSDRDSDLGKKYTLK